MKIILSRKGFDSSAGGCASPILPNGAIASLPIPEPSRRLAADCGVHYTYGDVATTLPEFETVGDVLTALGRPFVNDRPHLDPDLYSGSRPRKPGWRAAFGQVDAAERHLRNSGVGVGDLFLFFGWFHDVEFVGRSLRRVPRGRDIYLIFGWLHVGQIVRLREGAGAPPWTHEHPHYFDKRSGLNTLYIASDDFMLLGSRQPLSGAGIFNQTSAQRILTAPGARRKTCFSLPTWFMDGCRPALTYHQDDRRWTHRGDHVELQMVYRGQEFVLDTVRYPKAPVWAYDLLTAS